MQRAGYEPYAACESDPWRRAALQRNFPDTKVYEDVRDVGAARLLRDFGFLPPVIVGSPPCQDASSANAKGRGVDGERTGLFFEAIRIVAECRPVWCCFENVPGLRARGVDRVLAGLEEAGYACWPLVVGAVHAGAPHRRNRVWLVGVRADAYADGCVEPDRRTVATGRRERGAEADAGAWAPADASGLALWQQPGRGGGADGAGAAEPRDDGAAGVAADADEARRADGCLEPGLREAQEPVDRCAFAQAWPDWNGGFAGFGRVDDGLPRGVARAALAAYGDAVVPQITEAIGRAMRALLP